MTHSKTTVYELIRQLAQYDPNLPVTFQGYRPGDEEARHNRAYEVANVDGFVRMTDDGPVYGVDIYGWEIVNEEKK